MFVCLFMCVCMRVCVDVICIMSKCSLCDSNACCCCCKFMDTFAVLLPGLCCAVQGPFV